MATYKVIQDIEAEDKLLGPLSLRQFIYAVIVIGLGFVAFKLATVNFVLALPFLIPMGFFGLLAAPIGQNQSSEVWLLAKIRFFLKPRKRIWDQAGMKQLVTITAPKKIERVLTDGLTQTEVRSRLKALASTIDSRGWAVKNVNVNLSDPAFAFDAGNSDRLIAPSALPQDVPGYDIYAADDIMDERNNPTAQALDAMVSRSTQAHIQAAAATIQPQSAQATGQPTDYWFMNQPDASQIPAGQAAFGSNPTVFPGASTTNPQSDTGISEQALLQKIHKEKAAHKTSIQGHSKVIQPVGDQRDVTDNNAKQNIDQTKVNAQPAKQVDPELLRLATNDDLNVSTIAREAGKATKPLEPGADGEVVISLR